MPIEKPPSNNQMSGTDSESVRNGVVEDLTWTPEEERKLRIKADLIVMPLLFLSFAVMQLNRGNYGFALTDNFFQDVGVVQNEFNIAQQLLSVGVILAQIPTSLALYRFGPRIWLSALLFSLGLIATFQSFQKGLGALCAVRILFGLCGGGVIPAGLYCITMWYKKSETSLRFAVFFMGNSISQASSGLISFGILHMRGVAGLTGWQWLFILDGVMALLVGCLFVGFFPGRPDECVSLLGVRVFNEREQMILHQRVLLDDPSKQQIRTHVTLREMGSVMANWRMYPHLFAAMLGLAPGDALASYAPLIINSFGYPRLQSNAMVSVGRWIQFFLGPVWGYLADRTGRRGLLVLIGISLWWTFVLTSRLLVFSESRSAKFGVLSMCLGVLAIWHPINGSWLALNCKSAEERNVTMATYVMWSNFAGLIGSQLFQSEDKPLYLRGWTAAVTILSAAVLCVVFANLQYRFANRRMQKMGDAEEHEGVEDSRAPRLYML